MNGEKIEAAQPQQKAKKKEPARQGEEKGKTVMYIGPSIKNVAETGTLYTNGLPELLKKEMEKQPVLGSLIVPADRIAEARKELNMPGSALATVYGKVVTG